MILIIGTIHVSFGRRFFKHIYMQCYRSAERAGLRRNGTRLYVGLALQLRKAVRHRGLRSVLHQDVEVHVHDLGERLVGGVRAVRHPVPVIAAPLDHPLHVNHAEPHPARQVEPDGVHGRHHIGRLEPEVVRARVGGRQRRGAPAEQPAVREATLHRGDQLRQVALVARHGVPPRLPLRPWLKHLVDVFPAHPAAQARRHVEVALLPALARVRHRPRHRVPQRAVDDDHVGVPLARARVPTVVPAHPVVRVEVHPPRAPRVRRLGVLAAVVGAEDEEVGHARVLGAQLQIAPDLLVLARRRVVCGAQAERARDALHRLPVEGVAHEQDVDVIVGRQRAQRARQPSQPALGAHQLPLLAVPVARQRAVVAEPGGSREKRSGG
mmetsp:Transcript_41869/g.105027  ORF Transcript_41869/g.105027 Transcript_41869/m.105027 type:complete len:381 (-) Transcript_41869:1921-3063(-)